MSVVLVTGGSHGIGLATVQTLVTAGYFVASLDVERATFSHSNFADFQTDVSSFEAVRDGVAAALKEFGRFDAVVNNAGIVNRSSFLSSNPQEMMRVIGVNIGGLCNTTYAVMQAQKGSEPERIVNVSSSHAVLAQVNRSIYSATKAATESMTRSLAGEFAPLGTKVFCVAPGYTVTETGRTRLVGQRADRAASRVPLGRAIQASEIANGILILIKGELDALCGQVLRLDGGWSATDVELERLT